MTLSSSRMCACCECLSRMAKILRLRPDRRRYSSEYRRPLRNVLDFQMFSGVSCCKFVWQTLLCCQESQRKMNSKRPTERRDGSLSICPNQMRMIGRHLNKCLLRLRFNVQCLSNRMRLFFILHISELS